MSNLKGKFFETPRNVYMAVKRFPIEAGHVMTFARAIGDNNPAYFDGAATNEGDDRIIMPPPTFVEASAHFDPDYLLRPKIGEDWFGSGETPTGKSSSKKDQRGSDKYSNGLHAEQRYIYHKNLIVGDVLSATTRPGKTWEKLGRRGGKLIFSELITEYRDQNNELVITATMVGVSTERAATSKEE